MSILEQLLSYNPSLHFHTTDYEDDVVDSLVELRMCEEMENEE